MGRRWFAFVGLVIGCLFSVVAGSRLAAQITPFCVSGCGGVDVAASPPSVTPAANTSGLIATYTITNNKTTSVFLTGPTCLRTGSVTSCGSISIANPDLAPDEVTTATVQYVTGAAGAGTLQLKVLYTGNNSSGYLTVTALAPGAPVVATLPRNRPDQLERSLCLTSAAGDAAWQCGDLFLAHAMPAFRTLGRDRELTLLYNSATAAPRPSVAVTVTEPLYVLPPPNVVAELWVVGPTGTETMRASATYATWGTGVTAESRQIVLSYDASDTLANPTGVYDYRVVVKNNYGASPAATMTGKLIVVNRSTSRFGRGWALSGIERIYPASTGPLLWVGGDGSAKLYSPVVTNFWVAPPAAYRDTLQYLPGTNTYVRRLRHGVTVTYDYNGRHITTTNRAGLSTTFKWGATDSLVKILLPPTSADSFQVVYDGTTSGKVDRLRDPGPSPGHVLDLTITAFSNGGQLTGIVDPDGRGVSFGYDAVSRQMDSTTNRAGYPTTFWYGPSLKVDSVRVPYGPDGSQIASTVFQPWDEKGLAVGLGNTGISAVDTAQVFTVVQGPRGPNIADNATFKVDRWGAPRRIVNAEGGVTIISRGDTLSYPALVTRVTAPNGRVDSLEWNSRANLLRALTITTDQPTQVTRWTYTDTRPAVIDAPTNVYDPLDRATAYFYNAQGFVDSTLDARGLRTQYLYSPMWLVRSVRMFNVPTWRNADSTTNMTFTLLDSLEYDARGNTTRWWRPNGTAISYALDGWGRVTKTYDPYGVVTRLDYDSLNRVTRTSKSKTPEPHPGGIDARGLCTLNYSSYVVCVDSTTSMDPPSVNPGTDSAYFPTRYAYGSRAANVRDSLLDPRKVLRTYQYDALGTLWMERDDFGVGAETTRDAAGLITRRATRDLNYTYFDYDVMGRRIAMRIPSRGNQHPSDNQVVAGDTVASVFDISGLETRTENARATITRGYYKNGALKFRKVVAKNTIHVDSLAFSYDLAGALTKTVYNGMDSVRYTYNTAGDLDSLIAVIKNGAGSDTRVFRFTWDVLGRRAQVLYPENGLIVSYAYDMNGTMRRLRSTMTVTPANATNRLEFELRNRGVSATGQILSQTVTCSKFNGGDVANVPCGLTGTQTAATRYNHLGMVSLQTLASRTDSMRYDGSGNMVYRRIWDAGAGTWNQQVFTMATGGAFGVSNRLAKDSATTWNPNSSTSFFFTNSGDRKYERPTAAADSNLGHVVNFKWYYYDGLGRMSGSKYVTGAWDVHIGPDDCRYDGEGNMIKPCENGAPLLLYDGPNVAYTSNGWRFIHGPGLDDPVMAFKRNPTTKATDGAPIYLVTDGSGRLLSAGFANGSLTSAYLPGGSSGYQDFWAYSGAIAKAQTFAPDRFDGTTAAVSGLSFFRNRAYDSRTGRWTQEDPIGAAGGVNLYQYNGNDPVSNIDPFGLDTLDVEKGARKAVSRCRSKSATCDADFQQMENSSVVYKVAKLDKGEDFLDKQCFAGCTSPVIANNQVTIQIRPSDFDATLAAKSGIRVDATIVVGHEAGHAVSVTSSGTGCTDRSGCAKEHENKIRKELGDKYGQNP